MQTLASNDPSTRKRKRIVVYIGECPIAWKSAKQRIATISAMEAETVAAVEACRCLVWIIGVLRELQFLQTGDQVVLSEDDQSVILHAENERIKPSSKHIDIQWLREVVTPKVIRLGYRPTAEQVADILTKSTPTGVFFV